MRSIRLSLSLLAALYLSVSSVAVGAAAKLVHDHVGTGGNPWSLVSDGAAQYLVVLVLDGARPEYLTAARLPHIAALRSHGTLYTQAMDGILESETPAGHTTLTTGSTPRTSGILGFNWAQNDNDFSLFSPAVIRAGTLEQIMRQSGVPTIAGLFKKHYPGSRVVALSGHKYYAADPLGGPDADAILYFEGDSKGRYGPVAIPGHVPPAAVLTAPGLIAPSTHLAIGTDDHLANMLAVSAVRIMRPRVLLVNEPEFDWPLGHVQGGSSDPRAVSALMRGLDRDLGRIESVYQKAHILSKTLFAITADHGMAPITHFIPSTVITDAVARAHTTAPSIAYNQAAYVWLRNRRKAMTVARGIAQAHDPGVTAVYALSGKGQQRLYRPVAGSGFSARVEKANQVLLNTLLNGHEPAVVALTRTDATFSSSATHWKGDHGGASWQSQHIPLLLSGPGIRSGQVITAPAQLDDLAPTVLRDLGVVPAGMEGHVLTEALQHSDGPDEAARGEEVRALQPVTAALVVQDAFELSHPLK